MSKFKGGRFPVLVKPNIEWSQKKIVLCGDASGTLHRDRNYECCPIDFCFKFLMNVKNISSLRFDVQGQVPSSRLVLPCVIQECIYSFSQSKER